MIPLLLVCGVAGIVQVEPLKLSNEDAAQSLRDFLPVQVAGLRCGIANRKIVSQRYYLINPSSCALLVSLPVGVNVQNLSLGTNEGDVGR